MNFAAAAAQ